MTVTSRTWFLWSLEWSTSRLGLECLCVCVCKYMHVCVCMCVYLGARG